MISHKAYENQISKYRAERETRLRENERSWLALAGLFWLEEGNNTFGGDKSNDIQLENPNVPAKAGIFQYKNDVVTIKVNDGATVTCDGEPIRAANSRVVITRHHRRYPQLAGPISGLPGIAGELSGGIRRPGNRVRVDTVKDI